jgi:glycerol-3-phosphate dehydrogenase
MAATANNPGVYDLFVVGGGINGVGITRDAAGRGLSVYLCEKSDLARGTSSASTKLIHGGLRYLEFYEFRLVREALHEREVLLNSAPHIIWPVEFVLPYQPNLRSYWLLRIGLFLYDHLAKRKRLPASYAVNLRESRFGKPLKKFFDRAFVYADCWVEDSRLVALTALDAAQRGASINTYTQFVRAKKNGDFWDVTVQKENGPEEHLKARHLVNAGGPGLHKVAERIEGAPERPAPLRLIKGSHIVVPRVYDGEHAYILQHPDRRIVFIIPFEDNYSLIGTTDTPADESELENPKITDYETDYLLEAVNQYFNTPISRNLIQYTYSGIRPLFDDSSTENARAVSRDYHLTLDNDCLSVFGGKITTFRRLAEEAVDKILAARHEHRPHWTARAVLPGGDIGGSLTEFTQKIIDTYPFLPERLATRLASHYGTRVHDLLRGVTSMAEMGKHFGNDLYAREVDFLVAGEWARRPDDILLRRTKLGLHVDETTKHNLAEYLYNAR